MTAIAIGDCWELGRRRPHFLFEYIDGGAPSESTLPRNVTDLQDIALRQRVLQDVSTLDLTAELASLKVVYFYFDVDK
jgi:L-lactate dehydrogenase (cytochrome)